MKLGHKSLIKAMQLLDKFLGLDNKKWSKAFFYGVVCLNLSAKIN